MGKTVINYTCGHQQEVNLFGKLADRARKEEWLGTQKCYRCAQADVGVITTLAVLQGGQLQVRVTGNTYPAKDSIKSLGYRFDKFLPTEDGTQTGWYKNVPADDAAAWLEAEQSKLAESGLPTFEQGWKTRIEQASRTRNAQRGDDGSRTFTMIAVNGLGNERVVTVRFGGPDSIINGKPAVTVDGESYDMNSGRYTFRLLATACLAEMQAYSEVKTELTAAIKAARARA